MAAPVPTPRWTVIVAVPAASAAGAPSATVPTGGLAAHGPAAIAAELSGWYGGPGRLYEFARSSLPGGEVVRFTRAWTDNGNPMAAHQVHLLEVEEGAITRHDIWCGGRWDAALQAEIEAGLQAAREGS